MFLHEQKNAGVQVEVGGHTVRRFSSIAPGFSPDSVPCTATGKRQVAPDGAGFIFSIFPVGSLRVTHGYPEAAPNGAEKE